ncbi:DUF397 domain-containing protein [Streptomyces sp. Tu6071]|uniref:DUF397 domain-containing protein n=1 Tax=Streptomyces sp. Tu6071 TaxID=355249 RepID=UPI0009979DAA|nr:DUF397 domain-containing protein [Streptomyces sp. Tu6071]
MVEEGWVKSSYSNSNGGGCVEWASNIARTQHVVPVRDSKDVSIPGFTVAGAAWGTFVESVK